jgi:hypothetical protein
VAAAAAAAAQGALGSATRGTARRARAPPRAGSAQRRLPHGRRAGGQGSADQQVSESRLQRARGAALTRLLQPLLRWRLPLLLPAA